MSHCEVPAFILFIYFVTIGSFIIFGILGITKLTLCDTDSSGKINGILFQKILIRVLYLDGKQRNVNLELDFFSPCI